MYAVVVKTSNQTLLSHKYANTRALTGLFKRLKKKYPSAELITVHLGVGDVWYDMHDNRMEITGQL